jgi:predicted O-linked N-acetylglucosamine transferase (SPINDLY family)
MLNNHNNLQSQKFLAAIAHKQRQIQLKPDDAEAYKELGNALQALGKLHEAKRAYSLAVEIQPDFAAAHANIGNICYLQGDLASAVEFYERAIAIAIGERGSGGAEGRRGGGAEGRRGGGAFFSSSPHLLCPSSDGEPLISSSDGGHPRTPASLLGGIYANLGNVRQQQGLLEEAVACWQEALSLDPNFGAGQLHWKLGNVLLSLGRYGEGIDCYEKLISLDEKRKQPDELAKLYSNLGTARLYDGQVSGAIAAFKQALEIQPELAELHCNLGLATGRLAATSEDLLLASDRFQAAVNYFLRSLELKPRLIETHRGLFELIRTFQPSNWDLSSVRQAADRYYAFCRELGQNEPAKVVAATAGAIAYLKSGNADIATKLLQEIEPQLSPEKWHPWLSGLIDLLYSSLLFCRNRLRDDLAGNSQISQLIGAQFSEYLSNVGAKHSGNQISPLCDRSSARMLRPSPSGNQISPVSDRSSARMLRPYNNEKLKIGFISAHFRRHSVGWCSADIITELSQITPNIYLYQTEKINPDDITDKFQQISAKFYQSSQLNQETQWLQIIKQIEKDRLDILIDLDSLTIPRHADILHCQPAPVCMSWLGFDAPFISDKNYFLSDRHCHPAGVEQYYREKLLRMPDSFVAVSGFASEPVDRESKRQEMGIESNQVVYLCAAPATKLNPELALAQIKIIKQVPHSILLYKGMGDIQVIQSVYQTACAAENVSFNRLKFLPRNRTEEAHRTVYQLADICLDSYPYNGGTHNLEALWFNLPVVTRFGEQFLARMGYSCLKTLGISAGLAASWEEYVAWGIKFGLDAGLRNGIREQLKKAQTPEYLSPLWNPQKFAQDMYKILQQLREREMK